MPDIFISYRREDTSGYAGRIFDQLSAHFGRDHVFMDVADLEPGSDFVVTIEKKVGTCNALVALIGNNWLTIKDDQNQPRLSQPGDFVCHEISAALNRNIEVIPVLVAGAKMPREEELPQSLKPLSRRQAIEISDVHFTRDVSDLIEALTRPPGERASRLPKWSTPAPTAFITAACALALGIGIWIWQAPRHAASPVPPRSDAPFKPFDNSKIAGNWLAVVQKDNVSYEIYFTFEVMGSKLLGKAIYPTGEAGILGGTVDQGRLSFATKHIPNFEEQEATINVEGTVSGDQIEVIVQTKDGYSKGFAHRVSQVGIPKVLAPQ